MSFDITHVQVTMRISKSVVLHKNVYSNHCIMYMKYFTLMIHSIEFCCNRLSLTIVLQKDKKGKGIISATYTGVMPLVYNVQRSMLKDLISSYLTALILVGIKFEISQIFAK